MSDALIKPVIFISYSHKDEPEHPLDGEIRWLSFVRTYLQPAVKHGIFDLWVDRHMLGGADWDPEIEDKLRACDIFILLVSANSMASDYIIDREIAIIRERQSNKEDVHFYPLLLTPTPDAGLDKVKDKNLRPRDAKPFSSISFNDRMQHMTDAANEIAKIAKQVVERKPATHATAPSPRPAYVHITRLPETAYERLVGRDAELKRLDAAWADRKTNILSLIAEGGAGKSALVNEWLKRLQADNYRGAETVLGWSFYSQGSKERATAADEFLNWALAKLGIKLATTSASAKAEAIAEAMMQRRVLLLLDGVEPLQHGPGPQLGHLKDLGLRALLRRFAATPPGASHGLVVLTSRLAVKDIARWQDGAAPVVDVERLSDEAGAALLRDNGVWGTDKELKAAAHDFGGHPLALGLLASFLNEKHFGDVRRRDRIREFFADQENPYHDHARRVMESYEQEWFADESPPEALGFLARLFRRPRYSEKAIMRAIMHIVGLFDRPASGDCLRALRQKPAIRGLTDAIVNLDDAEWRRAVARLRDVRLLAPPDPAAPDALDAHPLVREWFGERLRQTNDRAWRAAHSRLYKHLRNTTKEGKTPTLEDLAPLYQAIAHGCRAGRHQEVLDRIYKDRICRRWTDGEIQFYATNKLGALGSDLATISWFFDKPYEKPVTTLTAANRSWILGMCASSLRAQGRFAEALPAQRAALRFCEGAKVWRNAADVASNLSEVELIGGEVTTAVATAKLSIAHADRSGDEFKMLATRTAHAKALHAAGRREEAECLFVDAERRQKAWQPSYPLLYSDQGYRYCDLLLAKGNPVAACDRATQTLSAHQDWYSLLSKAIDTLTLGRAYLGLTLSNVGAPQPPSPSAARDDAHTARDRLDEAVDGLRGASLHECIAAGLLARAAFRRNVGDWDGAARDLDEVEEIAEPGPMRLHLCDMALERARLAFARSEAFAPLNGLIDDAPPKLEQPSEAESKSLQEEAAKQLAIAADYIETCGYHRRDEELSELQAVLRGERSFASLPPRV